MTKGLYEFYEDFGRMGVLNSAFIAEDSDVKEAMGKEAYFGEALGKHSEVFVTLTEENITLISDSPIVVEALEKQDFSIGYNPLEYSVGHNPLFCFEE